MESARLFIGNLGRSVTDGQLKDMFACFGRVRRSLSVEGKGFGLVEMSNSVEAKKASEVLHGSVRDGRRLVCIVRQ